jgi:hypothetical protein
MRGERVGVVEGVCYLYEVFVFVAKKQTVEAREIEDVLTGWLIWGICRGVWHQGGRGL